MTIADLRPELSEVLIERGFTIINDFQGKVLDVYKSGKNLLIEGPEGVGKSTALQLCILHKITEAGEGSPRAIVVCPNDQKAIEFHANLTNYAKLLDLTVDLANDRGNILQQRNDIFDGTEIIVGTPRRLNELYIQNGYNVSKIKLFILDDATELVKGQSKTQIERLVESLPKCQHILTTNNTNDKRLEDYLENIVQHFSLIEAEG